MTKLETLLEKQKKLEEEIRSLERIDCGSVGIYRMFDTFHLRVRAVGFKEEGSFTIANAKTEAEMLQHLSVLMEDLADLYTQLEQRLS